MKRRSGLAAVVAALIVAAASCGYPTFQFNGSGPGGGGATSTSSTTASSSGGGATTSSSSTATSSSTSSSSTSSSTSTSTSSGAGCTVDHLLISQIRSRGLAGAYDEFIELYNPTSGDLTLDGGWTLDARDASLSSFTYSTRWTGDGSVVPAHSHYLVVGNDYAESPSGDGMLGTSISDAASLVLNLNGAAVNAVCYYHGATALFALGNGIPSFTCNGTPVVNPHDDTTGTNTDASLERKPGGAAGNCTDTGDNASDFVITSPADPQASTSPPAPG